MRYTRLLGCLALLAVTAASARTADGQLSSKKAEDWTKTLDAPRRLPNLRIPEIISTLHLKPGDTVADIGAGPGVFEVPFAKAVSPGGKVYAVEVDQGFLPAIEAKARAANMTNIHAILGKYEDPMLPAKDVDVAMFHDVLHHVENRALYLKNLSAYMKPTGRIAVIDYAGDKSSHKNPADQITRQRVDGWMAAAGFTRAETVELFDDTKMYVVYSRR